MSATRVRSLVIRSFESVREFHRVSGLPSIALTAIESASIDRRNLVCVHVFRQVEKPIAKCETLLTSLIDDESLIISIARNGERWMKTMKHRTLCTGLDRLHDRCVYMSCLS